MMPAELPSNEHRTMLNNFEKGLKSFETTQFALDPREVFEGQACDLHVVLKGDDVIYQIFPKKAEKVTHEVLGDLVEVYFGDLSRFSGSYVPELKSWALRAKNIINTPVYNHDYHVAGFARYLNEALAAL